MHGCQDERVSWVAPAVDRFEEPSGYDERSMLESMIEWHRTTLLQKCAGLDATQLIVRSVPPSTLSLLGLVRHLADAERAWFRRHFLGQQLPEVYARVESPDAAFDDVAAETAE